MNTLEYLFVRLAFHRIVSIQACILHYNLIYAGNMSVALRCISQVYRVHYGVLAEVRSWNIMLKIQTPQY